MAQYDTHSPVIRVTDLAKQFSVAKGSRGLLGALRGLVAPQHVTVKAVDGISFDIARGEIVGYLGPNGAGKSTTLKMLCGLLVPSAGEVRVDGRVPWQERKQHVAHIGAVFGQRTTLWWDLPVIESFNLLRHIYSVKPDRFQQNLAAFRQLLELDPFLNTPVRSLSLGQRMRADICAALLHDPSIVFLDEPTIGLDVVAKEHIRQFILNVNRDRGTTVILTTHDLSDVEKLCERIMIIDHGKLLFDDRLAELMRRFGGKRALLVEFAQPYDDLTVPGAELGSHDRAHATYYFDRAETSASDLIARVSARFAVADLAVREPDIEETVRRIYADKLLSAG
jgi:ABC-2 type transport system ATP-binding protein